MRTESQDNAGRSQHAPMQQTEAQGLFTAHDVDVIDRVPSRVGRPRPYTGYEENWKLGNLGKVKNSRGCRDFRGTNGRLNVLHFRQPQWRRDHAGGSDAGGE